MRVEHGPGRAGQGRAVVVIARVETSPLTSDRDPHDLSPPVLDDVWNRRDEGKVGLAEAVD